MWVRNLLKAMTNCSRWSEVLAAKFSEAEPGLKILQKTLQISILELLISLVGCIMCGKNMWEIRELRDSLFGACWSYFNSFSLKPPNRKIVLFFFEMLSIIVKMQNICNLIGWNSVHIADIFNCYSTNFNGV